MKATDGFSLTWCEKHKNWWVTNCPDCMVDSNESTIKQAGRQEVVDWMAENPVRWFFNTNEVAKVYEAKWQKQLKEWDITPH